MTYRLLAPFVLLACALTACGAPGQGSGPSATTAPHLITPADAKQVVETEQRINDEANAKLDTALLATIEDGPALAVDTGSYQASRDTGKPGSPPSTVVGTKVFVPHQSNYPAQFLSIISVRTTSGEQNRYAEVFTKKSATVGWKVSLYATLAATSPDPKVAVDQDGYTNLLAPTSASAPSRLSADLAQYLNSAAAGGSAGLSDRFADGPHTSQRAASLANDHNDVIKSGGSEKVAYTSEADGLSVPTDGGGAYTMFVNHLEVSLALKPGHPAVQNATRSPLSRFLPAGKYAAVHISGVSMLGAFVPPPGSPEKVTIGAFYFDETAATGTP